MVASVLWGHLCGGFLPRVGTSVGNSFPRKLGHGDRALREGTMHAYLEGVTAPTAVTQGEAAG